MSEATTQPAKPRHLRKRFLIPGILLTVIVLVIVGAVIRGTWADTVAQNPSQSSEGVLRQVFQDSEGHKSVRCALVIDAPVGKVWSVITDYDRFNEIFPYVSKSHATQDADGRWHLQGENDARMLGKWPFEVRVKHEETKDKFVASWDEPSHDLLVNQGSWTLTPLDDRHTLLVYRLEVQTRQFPTFTIRNVLLTKLPELVQAVETEVKKRAAKNGG